MFSMITVCSSNYRDAWEFVRPSWLNTSAEQIVVYTDDETWKSSDEDNRVSVVPLWGGSDSWLVNVGRKVDATEHALGSLVGNILFVDVDCWLNYDPNDTFETEFDLAVTRLHNKRIDTSTGVYFFHTGEFMRELCRLWREKQKRLWNAGIGRKVRHPSFAQAAFSKVARSYISTKTVVDLDVSEYNRKINDKDRGDADTKVFHFYNLAFRKQKLVDSVMTMLANAGKFTG